MPRTAERRLSAPSVRGRFAGVDACDWLVVDPHKWLMAPFDAAALIYRDPALARQFALKARPYLDPLPLGERRFERV